MRRLFLLAAFGLSGCLKRSPEPPPPVSGATGSCYRPEGMFGPVATNNPGARYGTGQTALATVQTSMAQPIEVCGVRGQLMWLMSARCADGSAPFRDPGVAHSARAGSMGAGGQCGSIIDLYQVPCPEETYSVYMDLYVCGPDESLR